MFCCLFFFFFFFNDTATTEIYTLSLHDALPISITRSSLGSHRRSVPRLRGPDWRIVLRHGPITGIPTPVRHTSRDPPRRQGAARPRGLELRRRRQRVGSDAAPQSSPPGPPRDRGA